VLDTRREPLPEQRPDAEYFKVRGRHGLADDPLCAITVRKAQSIGAHGDHTAEQAGFAEPGNEAAGHGRQQHD
jgi:hypothetical protein